MARPLRVVIVSSEVAPLATTGGLGRAVGGLASALKNLGVDVRVIMPKYGTLQASLTGLTRLVPKMRIRSVNRFGDTAIFRDELPIDLPIYLIEKDKYFDRPYLYGAPGESYPDNAERFCFFSLCALETLTQIGFFPDVIHCHDWHTGLIPVYLRMLFHNDPLFAPMTTVFTIHDIIHQGCFSPEELGLTGLPDSVYTPEGIEFYGNVSFLKAGIVYADVLTTESKRYSQEIQTPEYGNGFAPVLQSRSKDLYGVVNGVDYKHYDPRVDPFIAANYTKDEIEKKHICKQDLQEICKLPYEAERPLIAMLTSFDEQKGIDLVNQTLPQIVKAGFQCVFLNRETFREAPYAAKLKEFATQHESHIRWYAECDPQLEHKMLAGADFLLLPSKSEPCGELQMYSLKYGTIPIARATGGLDDTIVDFSEDNSKGNGIKFSEYTPDALMAALREALEIYQSPALWELIKNNAMRANYSWVYSAKKYLDLYKVAMSKASLSPITLS
jgi:starch synthase